MEGGTTLSSFENDVDMKTLIAVAWKAQQLPNFNAPEDGPVGRNM
jgi:hypothetical protein